MTRLADLSPADRKLVLAGRAQPAKHRTTTTTGAGRGKPTRLKCVTCGLIHAAWGTTRIEAHVLSEHGGGRIALILNPRPTTQGEQT